MMFWQLLSRGDAIRNRDSVHKGSAENDDRFDWRYCKTIVLAISSLTDRRLTTVWWLTVLWTYRHEEQHQSLAASDTDQLTE